MKLLQRVVGPVATNLYVLGDEPSREAIAVDTATPCAAWLTQTLAERGWTLKLIVSTHRHWDHIGDNAAVADHTGADVAVHPHDRDRLTNPQPLWAPFEIPPSVPAVELAEGSEIRFGEIRLSVLHTPGHTEGSVCLYEERLALLLSGDTLFPGGWGRTDLPGGDDGQMVDSLARLAREIDPRARVLPGHGAETTLERELGWMRGVVARGRLVMPWGGAV